MVLLINTERHRLTSGSSIFFNLLQLILRTLRRSSFWRYFADIIDGRFFGWQYPVAYVRGGPKMSSPSSMIAGGDFISNSI